MSETTVSDVMNAFFEVRAYNSMVLQNLSASSGIGETDYRSLLFIATNTNVTPKKVAEYLGLTTGSMTTLVDRLEAAGLAKRVPHPTDRRSLLLTLTKKGARAAQAGDRVYLRAFADAIDDELLPEALRIMVSLAASFRAAAGVAAPA